MTFTRTHSHPVHVDNFNENDNAFDGWNCVKITSCGKFGNVCGGYDTKAKGQDITKTFDVPAGKYSVTLDFVKIDSWFVQLLMAPGCLHADCMNKAIRFCCRHVCYPWHVGATCA